MVRHRTICAGVRILTVFTLLLFFTCYYMLLHVLRVIRLFICIRVIIFTQLYNNNIYTFVSKDPV